MTGAPIVFVVDDDPSVRSSLKFLLSTVGLQVESFDSADAFLHKKPPDAPSCLVLDVRLPGLSGLDFQRELAARNTRIPIIFLTGHGDIPMSVRAMKAGAVEFLTKPFRDQDLLDAVRIALERDRARREQDKDVTILQRRFDSLTSREQEVISMVVSGMLNKQIADQLGTAESTVKVQRSRAIGEDARGISCRPHKNDREAQRPLGKNPISESLFAYSFLRHQISQHPIDSFSARE